jgi:Tol biopolymer transport system component
MKRKLLKADCVLSLLVLWSAVSAWSAPFQLVSQRGTVPAPSGGSGDSWGAIISPDGRFVLFASTANNLVLITNGTALPIPSVPRLNVFIRDRTNGTTTLVSVNQAGTGGRNGDSIPTALSTNGQFACFESSASDLIPNDTNGVTDVFVRDLINNTTTLVSTGTNHSVGNGVCRGSTMTPDGRYVAFVSAANSLVPSDTNNIPDVFVRDLQGSVTTLVSVGARSTNSLLLSSSESPEITPDGRYVAFFSSATNLVPTSARGGEIYVRDLIGGTTTWASTNAHTFLGAAACSYNHAISADGLYVAFEASSNAPATTASRVGNIFRFNMAGGTTDRVNTNAFVPPTPPEEINTLAMSPDGRFIAFVGNTNGTAGTTSAIFLWDGLSGTTLLISTDMTGNVPANSVCDSPAIDPTGRYVAFLSSAPNLANNAPLGGFHLYLRDTVANLTTLLDADTNGVTSSTLSPAAIARLNGNGNFAAFESLDAGLVPNDQNHDLDVFVRDVSSSSNILISARDSALASDTPNSSSVLYPRGISADGRRIVFSSDGDNLISADTNGFRDVFVRDLVSGTNILVSAATNGSPGDNLSYEGALSANGRFVAFTSSADDLAPSDSNKREDVFVRDLVSNTTALVSVKVAGTATGNQGSHAPTINADGRYVIFRSLATDIASGSFTGENLFMRDLNAAVTYALTTSGAGSSATTKDGQYVVFSGGPSNTVYVWDQGVYERDGQLGVGRRNQR